MFSLILVASFRYRPTRQHFHSHHICRWLAGYNFLPHTTKLWNKLSSAVRTDMTFKRSINEHIPISKAGNAPVVPLVLRVSMGGANRLPSGDMSVRLHPIP